MKIFKNICDKHILNLRKKILSMFRSFKNMKEQLYFDLVDSYKEAQRAQVCYTTAFCIKYMFCFKAYLGNLKYMKDASRRINGVKVNLPLGNI